MNTPFRLNREEKRLWLLHKKIADGFDWGKYIERKPDLEKSLRVRSMNANAEEKKFLQIWQGYLKENDLVAIRRALVSPDAQSIALRKFSPFV